MSSFIKTKGDPLGKPIHWQGLQWAVTGHGLQTLDGKYSIPKERLWEEEDGWGWEKQMAEKNWVDIAEFKTALAKARTIYPRLQK
jgi:hypothetical protein